MPEVQKRILIVDDDDEIRELLEFDIASSGYFVDTAKDGLEGLNKALINQGNIPWDKKATKHSIYVKSKQTPTSEPNFIEKMKIQSRN